MGLPSMSTAWFGEYKGEQFQNLVPSKSYDPENPYADPVAKLEHRDAVVRAKFVHVAKCQVCVLRGSFPLPPSPSPPTSNRLCGAVPLPFDGRRAARLDLASGPVSEFLYPARTSQNPNPKAVFLE